MPITAWMQKQKHISTMILRGLETSIKLAFFIAYLVTILKTLNARNEESSLQLSSLVQLVTRDITKETILCQSLNRPIYIKETRGQRY